MSNLNKVFLMGRLTRDPELRYTPGGSAVSDLGLAINREYTVGTERRKDTAFVDVTVWKRQAEVVCEYLKKGSPIFVEGRLSFDTWETKEGEKRSKLRVVAENFQFLGGGGGGERGGEGDSSEQGSSGTYGGGRADEGAPPGPSRGAPQQEAPAGLPVDESDIPF